MIDNIALFFLKFSHDILVVPILILGFIWLNREVFYHSICLFLFSMIYGYSLKVFFQIYSPIYGLIFPSGHMLAPTILYGWIAYKYNNLVFRIITLILLCGIGISLVHFNYHDYFDVIGGVFFALILIIAYNFILENKPQLILGMTLILSTTLIVYLYIKLNNMLPHLWLSYYALIGFSISNKIFNNRISSQTFIHNLISSLVCFLIIFVIQYIFNLYAKNLAIYLGQLKWLLIGASVSISCFISNLFLKKQRINRPIIN